MLVESALRIVHDSGVILVLLGGTVAGLVFGLAPGLSGRVALLIAFPWAIALDPFQGAVLLVALHAVIHTSGSLPAILFGIPTSAAEAATVVDGYPMMRSGRGGEAFGVTLASSAFGGVLGAVALMLLVPVIVPIITLFGTPEVAMLALLGLASISALAGSNLAAGVVSASLGVLASTIGVDALSGTPRYTYGFLQLWDGVNVAAVIAGIFVIPEMLARIKDSPLPGKTATRLRDVLTGFVSAFRHTFLMIRSTLIGIFVGLLPGMGASAAVWLAYGHAAQTTRRPAVPFGQGAVEGVIAPEAANNSKEGGGFAPTLFFAVPGSSGMAILMAAFSTMGIELGPRLMSNDPGFVLSVGWVILIANLLAIPLCLAFAPHLVQIARMRRAEVVPLSLALATLAVLATAPGTVTLIEIAAFGLVGTALARAGWPRAPFVLGFVIGPVFESALSRTVSIWGTSALMRPGVIVLAILAIIVLVMGTRVRAAAGPQQRISDIRYPATLAGSVALLFAAAGMAAAHFPFSAAIAPVAAAATGAVAALVFAIRLVAGAGRSTQEPLAALNVGSILLYGGALILAAFAGTGIAIGVFVAGAFYLTGERPVLVALASGAVAGMFAALAAGDLSLSF